MFIPNIFGQKGSVQQCRKRIYVEYLFVKNLAAEILGELTLSE